MMRDQPWPLCLLYDEVLPTRPPGDTMPIPVVVNTQARDQLAKAARTMLRNHPQFEILNGTGRALEWLDTEATELTSRLVATAERFNALPSRTGDEDENGTADEGAEADTPQS